jgi:hypothetical protein
MRRTCHDRQPRRGQHRLGASGPILMPLALPVRGLQMPDRGGRRGGERLGPEFFGSRAIVMRLYALPSRAAFSKGKQYQSHRC